MATRVLRLIIKMLLTHFRLVQGTALARSKIPNPYTKLLADCVSSLAWAEMRLILAKVLFNFDLELAEGSEDWLDQKAYAIWEKGPLNVRLKIAR